MVSMEANMVLCSCGVCSGKYFLKIVSSCACESPEYVNMNHQLRKEVIGDVNKVLHGGDQDRRSLEKTIKRHEQELAAFHCEYRKLLKTKQVLERDVISLELEQNAYVDELKNYSQLKEVFAQTQQQNTQLKKELSILKKTNSENLHQLIEMELGHTELTDQINRQRDHISTLESQLVNQQETVINPLQQDVNTLKELNQDYMKQIIELELEWTDMDQRINNQREMLSTLSIGFNSLQESQNEAVRQLAQCELEKVYLQQASEIQVDEILRLEIECVQLSEKLQMSMESYVLASDNHISMYRVSRNDVYFVVSSDVVCALKM